VWRVTSGRIQITQEMEIQEKASTLQTFSLRIDYPVVFSRNVLSPSNPVLFAAICRREPERCHSVAVAIDSNVAAAWPGLAGNIHNYIAAHGACLSLVSAPVIVPGGEACKNSPEEAPRLQRWMLDAKLDRQSVLLSIGGGAVLDLTGYAAATFHRGIRVIRLPTTVLAQNDAGVGVKNGINTFGVKNLVGCFAAPFGVISDFDFLDTLDARDKRAGLAEAVKVALIRDPDFFRWMEFEAQALAAFSPAQTETMIRRCAALHLAHIANGGDPFEFGSARPLDFGHWAAHKLETMTGYRLRHGEAVAIGMALDSCYSSAIGLLAHEQAESVCALLEALGFTLWDETLDHAEGRSLLLDGLAEFREHLGGELTLTMLADIGRGIEVHAVELPALESALATLSRRKRI
jgi:3-dehydroquinate synthase